MKLQKKYFLCLRFFKQKKRSSYQVEKNIDLLHTAFYVPGAMSSVYVWPDHLGRLLVATCCLAYLLCVLLQVGSSSFCSKCGCPGVQCKDGVTLSE